MSAFTNYLKDKYYFKKLQELAKIKGMWDYTKTDRDTMTFEVNRHLLTFDQLDFVDKIGVENLWSLVQMAKSDLKFFNVNNETFEIACNMDLNIHIADLHFPFNEVVFNLNPDYIKSRHVQTKSTIGMPKEVCVFKLDNPEILCLEVNYTDVHTIRVSVSGNKTLDEEFKETFENIYYRQAKPEEICQDDEDLIFSVCRGVINSLLFCDKPRLLSPGPAKEKELRKRDGTVNYYYTLSQNVKLRDERIKLSESEREGGWTTRPHWRRGHWRKQAFGVGLKERKLIRIDPVLVNKKMLVEDYESDVNYRI